MDGLFRDDIGTDSSVSLDDVLRYPRAAPQLLQDFESQQTRQALDNCAGKIAFIKGLLANFWQLELYDDVLLIGDTDDPFHKRIVAAPELRTTFIAVAKSGSGAAHEGTEETYFRLASKYYWRYIKAIKKLDSILSSVYQV